MQVIKIAQQQQQNLQGWRQQQQQQQQPRTAAAANRLLCSSQVRQLPRLLQRRLHPSAELVPLEPAAAAAPWLMTDMAHLLLLEVSLMWRTGRQPLHSS